TAQEFMPPAVNLVDEDVQTQHVYQCGFNPQRGFLVGYPVLDDVQLRFQPSNLNFRDKSTLPALSFSCQVGKYSTGLPLAHIEHSVRPRVNVGINVDAQLFLDLSWNRQHARSIHGDQDCAAQNCSLPRK